MKFEIVRLPSVQTLCLVLIRKTLISVARAMPYLRSYSFTNLTDSLVVSTTLRVARPETFETVRLVTRPVVVRVFWARDVYFTAS